MLTCLGLSDITLQYGPVLNTQKTLADSVWERGISVVPWRPDMLGSDDCWVSEE